MVFGRRTDNGPIEEETLRAYEKAQYGQNAESLVAQHLPDQIRILN